MTLSCATKHVILKGENNIQRNRIGYVIQDFIFVIIQYDIFYLSYITSKNFKKMIQIIPGVRRSRMENIPQLGRKRIGNASHPGVIWLKEEEEEEEISIPGRVMDKRK